MIAKVIPAIRLPAKASETYDYLVPERLSPAIVPGAVVIVPFSGRHVPAIVLEITDLPSTDRVLKEIYGYAHGLSPLPAYVSALLKEAASLFATTMPRLAWAALPAVPARSIRTIAVSEGQRGHDPLPEGLSAKDNAPFLVSYVNGPADANGIMEKAVESAGNRQVLVLCPTVIEAEAWRKAVKNAAAFHSGLSAGSKYDIACGTSNGVLRRVVGTKSAIFLPWRDLGAIIIVSSGSASHRQEDQDPRFDARVMAAELCRSTGARLYAFDSLAPLGFTSAGSDGLWTEANFPAPKEAHIHDLKDAAKAAKARVVLCEPLLQAIDETVDKGGRVLALLNRRGISSSYVCRKCGAAVSCPFCMVHLSVHNDRQSCPACERLFPLPTACSSCGSPDFRPVGFGSKSLADALRKRYPEADIMHIDRETPDIRTDSAQIVVGTTAVFRALGISPKPFDLAFDALLGAGTERAGIWATEEAARNLRSLSSALSQEGQLHVQTFDASAPAIKALRDPSAFLTSELKERRDFGYPPAGALIIVHGSGTDESALWEEAKRVIGVIGSHVPRATCHEPAWSSPKLFRGKFRLSFPVKMPAHTSYGGFAALLPNGFAAEVRLI